MQVKARDLTAGDTIKMAGYNRVAVTEHANRGAHTDLTLTTINGRVVSLTVAAGTRITRIDNL